MTFRQRLGLGAAPLVMRLALGAVFIWAGSSKLFVTDTFTPQQAATLANIGIVSVHDQPAAPQEAREVPMERDVPDGSTEEGDTPEELDSPAETAPTPEPLERPEGEAGTEATSAERGGAVIILAQNSSGGSSASKPVHMPGDFPEGVEARRLYSLALLLHARSNPPQGQTALWPGALASDTMLSVMPWLAAVTEFVGGIFLIVGVLARIVSLALAGVMGVAMLLTTIGPAAISSDPFLGFLPDPQFQDPEKWVQAWQTMLFQLTTGALALGVLFTGAGWLSLDRLIFRTPRPRGHDDDS